MNYPARLFRDLLSTWHNDCASHRVDSLAAELAARAGRADAAVCLGLIQKEAIASLFGLTYLLDSYGLVLRQRYRQLSKRVHPDTGGTGALFRNLTDAYDLLNRI